MRLRTRTHSKKSPNLRRGFFYALLLLHFSFLSAFSAPATLPIHHTIYGQTLDQDSQSIPFVSLIFTPSNVFILSDENGYFWYSAQLSENDSVMVQRIGYESQTFSIKSLLRDSNIRLSPVILSLESIEILAENKSPTGTVLAPISRFSKSSGSGSIDHSKMLGRIPGISIKSYGGPAGISTLSMDGGPSSHTKVLIDGIDITSAQNGEADISQLPLPFVERMSYIPYDISHSTSGGSDGIVKLGSGEQKSHLSISNGSFGHQAYDVNLRKQISGIWTSLQFGQRREAGNYRVFWDHESSFRKNNDLDQRFVSLKLRKMLRPDLFWQLTALESQQSRGVAGLVWSPDTLSHREDQLKLIGFALSWIRPSGSTRLQLSLRNSHENYVNPLLNLDSDHKLSSYHLNISNMQSYARGIELLTDLALSQDEIQSSATSAHKRMSYAASIKPGFQLIKNLKVVPSLKFQASPGLFEQVLADLQIQIPLRWGPLTKIAASRGDMYRYPSFNDLYWWPGGNPDLLAEETQVTTAQIQFDLDDLGQFMFQWQKKESANLIQWMPVHSYWQPENVQSADRESSKLIWQLNKPLWRLSTFAHLSLIHTFDEIRQKPMRYAPTQTSAFGINWSPSKFEINLQYNYVSDRISMYDYPLDTILKAAELWSLSVAHTWSAAFGGLTLVIAGDNLLDVQYESIRGYPEPGRSMRVTATFNFE